MSTSLNLNNHDEIRNAVKASYGARARGEPMKDSGCCSTPSASQKRSCCSGTDFKSAATRMGYSEADLADVPEESNLGLGCGAPLQKAGVKPGMVVLDLGSGAGFDAFLAASAVGPTGRVIGVDMTPAMVSKAIENAAKRSARATTPQATIEFHEGLIEKLPLKEDNFVDVVISNCVINLSPDKEAVFREAYRVLKPGSGHICVSDIILLKPLPPKIRSSLAAYMGCIASAILMDDYMRAIEQAGFVDVQVTTKPAFSVLQNDDPVIKGIEEGLEEGQTLEDVAAQVVSAMVIAYKK